MTQPSEKELIYLIKDDPSNAEHYQELGKYYLRNSMLDQAAKFLKISLELNCNDGWTYLYMGNLYDQRGQYQDALCYFEQAVELMPEESIVYCCIAEMYAMLENFDQANAFFEKAVQIEPQDEVVLRKLKKWKKYYIKH